jgi:hypothetical protein
VKRSNGEGEKSLGAEVMKEGRNEGRGWGEGVKW